MKYNFNFIISQIKAMKGKPARDQFSKGFQSACDSIIQYFEAYGRELNPDESTPATVSAEGVLKKYQKYIDNLEWHLRVNKDSVSVEQSETISQRIKDFKEIVHDLQEYSQSKTTAVKEVAVAFHEYAKGIDRLKNKFISFENDYDYWLTNIHNKPTK